MRRFVLFLLSLFIGALLSISVVLQSRAQTDYLVPWVYNQDAVGITYYGTWTTTNNVSATAGNFVITATDQNYLRFSCICDEFDVIYVRCSTCGILLIYVDGYEVYSANTWAASDTWGVVANISGLTNGYHTITVKRGALNPAPPLGEFLAIDGFIIYNSASAPPTSEPQVELEVTVEVVFPEQTPEPVPWRDEYAIYDTEGNTREVAFDYKLTAGEVLVGVLLFGILFMMIVQFILSSWKKR